MSIHGKIGSTTLGILAVAGLLLSYVPNVDAATCTAFGTGCGDVPNNFAQCPAANPKGIAICFIGQGNPNDPPTNRQLLVDHFGPARIAPPNYTTGWGINSSGGIISGCSASDLTIDYYAKDYYGCNSMVRSKVTVIW